VTTHVATVGRFGFGVAADGPSWIAGLFSCSDPAWPRVLFALARGDFWPIPRVLISRDLVEVVDDLRACRVDLVPQRYRL
jgi:hypothetical protein